MIMKKIFIVLLYLSCAKPDMPAPDPVRGDVLINIETGNNTCAVDLLLSLQVGGRDYGASNENPCGQFPIGQYKNMLLWHVPLNDIFFRVAGCVVYSAGFGTWKVTLTGPAGVISWYRYTITGYVLEVEEWKGDTLYRTYKQSLL